MIAHGSLRLGVSGRMPNWDGKGFGWPDLELKVAGKKGLGVFAAHDLPKGTEIPILGEKKEERYCTNRHNIAFYDRSRPGTGFRGCIDGDPTQYPYKMPATLVYRLL